MTSKPAARATSGKSRFADNGGGGLLPSVEVGGLQHSYGTGEAKKQILFDNNLEVDPGEIVIMTGPSGSGKTSLLTLIGTLRSVQEGSLKILGQELLNATTEQVIAARRQIGFIFQAHNLFESLTAYQNVSMAAELFDRPQGEVKKRIEELLGRLGLGNRIHYKPSNLSGGQKQRVAIARGLVHRPKLVLADEPTAALDEESGREAITMLHEMAKQDGTTVIVVTHDNRILDFADRIVHMVDGRIKSDINVKETARICEYLTSSETFSQHAVGTLTKVADRMLVEEAPAGATVIRQGDAGDKFYLIRSGRVDVMREGADGTDKVADMTEGDFFGEVALLSEQPRNATVVATEPSVFYTLGKADFLEAVSRSESFEGELRKVIFDRQ